ncbi:MAG: ATP-binding cassette domain-containing protein, partial [Thermoanaerobaculia bacterium]
MILCADSISKTFSGRRVLSSARLAVEAGQVVGVLGRMGMGKSTLMKICVGVLESDSGWVEFAGRQYQRPRFSTLASRGLFYLAESDNLAGGRTVAEHFDLIE